MMVFLYAQTPPAEAGTYVISFETILELFGGGGLIAGIIAIISLWWKIKSESKNSVELAKAAAVESSSKAIDTMSKAMDAQSKQVDQLSERVRTLEHSNNDLNARVTSLDTNHRIAVIHIGERELWARRKWASRPATLPTIPEALLIEVISANPELKGFLETTHPIIPSTIERE